MDRAICGILHQQTGKLEKKFLALSLSYSAVFSLTATVKENALFPRHMFLCVCVSAALMLPIPCCFH